MRRSVPARATCWRVVEPPLAGFLAELGDPDLARPLASVMLAAVDGLALQHLLDPDFDVDQAFAVLSRMQEAVLAASRSAGADRRDDPDA